MEDKTQKEKIIERLADIEHQRWADWQAYMHSKILPSADEGISNIGTQFIERWTRQVKTPYSELLEEEKESDRNQVKRYFPIVEELIDLAIKETEERIVRIITDADAPYTTECCRKTANLYKEQITNIIRNK